MTFYTDMAATAEALLSEFGMPAVLRAIQGNAADKPCTVCIYEYRPRDAAQQLANPTDRCVLISPFDPETGAPMAVPPNNETDVIVCSKGPDAGVRLPLTAPVKLYAPGGVVVLYECTTRR